MHMHHAGLRIRIILIFSFLSVGSGSGFFLKVESRIGHHAFIYCENIHYINFSILCLKGVVPVNQQKFAADKEFLSSEGISECDVFVAVTQDDESNVLCSLMSKKLGSKKTITIINKEAYFDLVGKNELDIIISLMKESINLFSCILLESKRWLKKMEIKLIII